MKYNVLLADNDGTLMDFDASERVALKEAMDRQGVRLDEAREKLYSEINARLWEAFERRETTQAALRVDRFRIFLKEIKSPADAERMSEDFLAALSLRCDEIDGAYDFLREAAARVPVVMITNGFIETALARVNADPARALILGDSLTSDIAAANASHVAGCWFNPKGKKNTTAFSPDYEIRTLKEALEWL